MSKVKLSPGNIHIKLKNSLFCGLKGWLIFNLASITVLELSLYSKIYKNNISDFQKEIVEDSKQNAKYQVKNNIIPFCEVMFVMPAVFLLAHYFGKYILPTHLQQLKMYLICLAPCFGIMIMICLTLRILGIRKDCCSTIKHPIYRNSNLYNNDFINFTRPNSLNKVTKHDRKFTNTLLPVKAVLFSILMTPLVAIKAVIELTLFTIEMLELPFSFILDICTLLYNKITHSHNNNNFSHSKTNLNKMISFLYAGSRDLIVTCSLGILNAKIIKDDGNSRSPISYLDGLFISNITSRKEIPQHKESSPLLV